VPDPDPVAYQVLARKWRPQTFDEVVGQQGVTQTLRNTIASGRIGQAFIFAGPRGVGKTTTARILAKALNCVKGPTVDPCGACEACVEIGEGRDMDVLEIDAATHTGVDNVREVIVSGLGVRPARDRYKIFVIDEVHMLSTSSFNALLKSIEEPPPHVVFMMATTELHKIPDTIRSRAQEFEFKTIGTRAIAAQLEKIAKAEGLTVEPAALQLIARAAEGSLRDAESAFDQVIAFAGETVSAEDAATVLGLVGRDFLFDVVETVADEDARRVFDVVGRAVESGLDLRLLCRELARLVRDLMVVAIDPARLAEPDFAPEGDPDRLQGLAARFSREDLLRAFDILSRAEFEIRTSPQPRYHLEMALLKWIYARGMVPITELIEALEAGAGSRPASSAGTGVRSLPAPSRSEAGRMPSIAPAAESPGSVRRIGAEIAARRAATPGPGPGPAVPASSGSEAPTSPVRDSSPAGGSGSAPAGERSAPPRAASPDPVPATAATPEATTGRVAASPPSAPGPLKDALLDAIRKGNKTLYSTAIAQAYRVEVGEDTLTFSFGPQHRIMAQQIEQKRAWLEGMAEQVAGRRLRVIVREADGPPAGAAQGSPAEAADRERLRERALAETAVQAMLDVFPAEIRDVEEIEE
jgi:DNA polymerase-3 subunit gamma/tau